MGEMDEIDEIKKKIKEIREKVEVLWKKEEEKITTLEELNSSFDKITQLEFASDALKMAIDDLEEIMADKKKER